MSDLISRQAVDSEICKLIEKLELKGLSMSYDMDDIIELQMSIDDMPIAYDVDKVVEQLEDACCKDIDGMELPIIGIEDAIEIVKVGGKDE